MIAGQPTRIPLTVMVNFILKEGSQLMVPGRVDFHIDSVRLRFLNKVAPTYPPEALKKNIQGKVVMMAFVNKKGSVCHVKAFKGNPILAKAAETAMNQWRFKPYIIKGKRQSILFAVTFTFNITRKSK
jgi:protein TonB